LRRIAAADVASLRADLTSPARVRAGFAADAPIVSCHEAGRHGFWLHCYLVAQGITNYVVDSATIDVNRHSRRIKADGMDLGGLLKSCSRGTSAEITDAGGSYASRGSSMETQNVTCRSPD
jgi:transposase